MEWCSKCWSVSLDYGSLLGEKVHEMWDMYW
jgi:hypothetical protein